MELLVGAGGRKWCWKLVTVVVETGSFNGDGDGQTTLRFSKFS